MAARQLRKTLRRPDLRRLHVRAAVTFVLLFRYVFGPMTLAVDAARARTIGQGDALGPTLGTLAWLVGLLLVPLSVRAFRRA